MSYRRALAIVDNRDDALDVCQSSLLTAWQHIGGFRAQSSFGTWLYRIVTTEALDHRRRQQRHAIQSLEHFDDMAAGAPGPADQAENRQTARELHAAITALPAPQRTALLLHAEHRSYAHIATTTHSTVPAVRSHLHRARKSLRATLSTP